VRVLIAFDKFKGSLGAPQACELAAGTLRGLHRNWQLDLCPLTDGGEGFIDILTKAMGGQRLSFKVTEPRDGFVDASLGIVAPTKISASVRHLLPLRDPVLKSGKPVAVIEMTAASGLHLLPREQHDP